MEQLQLAFNRFSNLMFDKMSELDGKINDLQQELEDSKGQQKFTRKEAREFIGVSNPTFQRYINNGLPVHGTPKKQIFFKQELLDYIKNET